MSQQNLKMFYETLAKDETLKAEVTAIATRHGGQQLDDSQEDAVWTSEILPLAKSHGFDFTLDEVKAHQAIQSEATGKLADEELDVVVGGSACTCYFGGGGGKGEGYTACVCVLGGAGLDGNNRPRCVCVLQGQGDVPGA